MPNLKNDSESQFSPRPTFDPATLGRSFEQLAIDIVRGETTDFMSRWFRSREGEADLVIWTDSEKRIIKHQLCFYGQVVEWNPVYGTRTGLIVEEEMMAAQDPELYGENPPDEDGQVSEMIRFDRTAQMSVVQQAMMMLTGVPDLNDHDRSMLIYNLRESPRLHKNARERAMKVWAPKVEELQSNQRPHFWRRLRTWVLGD